MLAGLLAGAIQNRFQTASEVLTPDWNRVNPVEGFKRLFSNQSLVPTAIAAVKFAVVLALTYSEIRAILLDPIFTTAVSVGRLAEFLGQTGLGILLRVALALAGRGGGGLWLSILESRARPDDDQGGIEGRIQEHRRQPADQNTPAAAAEPPARPSNWRKSPRPTWW